MAIEMMFAPETAQDVAEAFAWYEARRAGLGEDFLSCVEACLKSVERNPTRHGVVHEQYHRALVRRFPYAVFYEFSAERITVYAILHTARDPQKWRQRLP